MPSNNSYLASILNIIASEGDKILKTFEKQELSFPSLDDSIDTKTEFLLNNSDVLMASTLLVAAAGQLIASVRPVSTSMIVAAGEWVLPCCLRVVNEGNVVELLREAGSQGLHVDDIAGKTKMDSWKLGRVMRYLATHHIFKEITPDVYTNNRLSSTLDTGKSSKDLFEKPLDKHDDTPGMSALVGVMTEESYLGSTVFLENMTDPKTSHSKDPKHCNISVAAGIDFPVWDWFALPENEFKLRRFGVGMTGYNSIQPSYWFLQGFDWRSLAPGSLVVDVGGGVGGSSMQICNQFPQLNIILQDRAEVVVEGQKWFNARNPEALSSGRMKFEVHNFFEPQPVREVTPSVFLLRLITHDWSYEWAKTILTHIRKVSGPSTHLIIIDSVLQCACPDPELEKSDIEGALFPKSPEPLLANLGVANSLAFEYDLIMYNNCNAQERTIHEFITLLGDSGWKIKRVYRPDPLCSWFSHILSVPV